MSLNLSELNPAQRQAVECTEGSLLVLAGAGSGKTRVLTHRIAHLIQDCGVKPWEVLAITFTNKAAREMRDRLEELLGTTRGMWICTFHALCVRIIRENAELIGYSSNFTIYSDSDSKRVVKNIMDTLGIDEKLYPLRGLRARISDAKNRMIDPDVLIDSSNLLVQNAGRVYEELQKHLKYANAMDFDDLLVYAIKILREYPEVLEAYQHRFRYISVDEYQDTNQVQYLLTKLLANAHHNLMVVGDDDQSIYSWRGADLNNILNFEKDYPDCQVIKLEQNYRSTGHILGAANAVVMHNERRKHKHLFTDAGDGEKIRLYRATDERDEGRWIGAEIEKLHDKGLSYADIAILIRKRSQTRILEDMLLRAGVPYVVVGGHAFYDSAEIQDCMAYLKLMVNPDDEASARRVINSPRRGVGTTSVNRIQDYARQRGISFTRACYEVVRDKSIITPKARRGVEEFCELIRFGRHLDGDLAALVEAIIRESGMISALEHESTVEAQSRLDNIMQFIEVAREQDPHLARENQLESLEELQQAGLIDSFGVGLEAQDQDMGQQHETGSSQSPNLEKQAEERLSGLEKLSLFSEWLSLRSDIDTSSGELSAVSLMTIHAAKGLEFPAVFVAGMEETIFPLVRMGEEDSLEEERRLAYVAITRARKYLYLTHASTRYTYGNSEVHQRSRFIDEIPSEHISAASVGSADFSGFGWAKRGDRHGTYGSGRGADVYGGHIFGSYTRSTPGSRRGSSNLGVAGTGQAQQTPKLLDFAVGDKVHHKSFGPGIVVSCKGDALEVKFERTGSVKKLLKGFAPLVKIED